MKKSKDKVKKPEPAKTETTTRGEVYDWMQSLVFALIICILVFVFLFRIVDVSGDSMNPTLTNGDKLVSVADATLIMQNKAVPSEFKIDSYGQKWGDVDNNGDGITAKDALAIQMIDAKLIKQADLPITSAKLESLKG